METKAHVLRSLSLILSQDTDLRIQVPREPGGEPGMPAYRTSNIRLDLNAKFLALVNELTAPAPPVSNVDYEPDLAQAMQIIAKAISQDPDYARAWASNIAMQFKDRFSRTKMAQAIENDTDAEYLHAIANDAAYGFLAMLTEPLVAKDEVEDPGEPDGMAALAQRLAENRKHEDDYDNQAPI